MSEHVNRPIEQQGRLRAIASISDALLDMLCGDEWHVVFALNAIAKGDQTVSQARINLGEGWETL